MSQDTTFPFADTDEALGFVDEADSGNRKAVLIAGGVAAALVLGVGGWFFLGGSGDDASLNDSSFVPAKPRTVAAAPNKVAAKPAKKLPVAYKDTLGRDPFKPLYVVPVAPAGTGTGTASGTTSSGTSTSTTSTSTTTSGTSTTPTSTTPTGTTRYTLKLVSISTPKPGEVRFFTWQVAGVTKTVIGGQRFGKFGEVVVLAYETNTAGKVVGAVIQVGDDSPIDVKIGESVSVL